MQPRTRSILSATLLSALALTPVAHAQEIELNAKDGSMNLKGTLLGFEDRSYRIRTSLGTLVINADEMDCVGEACPVLKPPAAKFRVSGSRTAGRTILPQLLRAYTATSDVSLQASDHPEEGRLLALFDAERDPLADIQVVNSTSSSGFVDLLQGDAQMALSARPPRPNEADAFEKSGLGLIQSPQQEFVLALQSVLIVVAPGNPVSTISTDDAAKIFAGTIRNWSEVGGPDLPITVYARDGESDTGSAFLDMVMGPSSATFRDDANIVNSDLQLAGRVANDPGGIGFTSFGAANRAKTLSLAGDCGLTVTPDLHAVKAEAYPLTRRISAYIAGEMPDQVNGFLEFMASPATQAAVGQAGFVTQDVVSADLNRTTERLTSAILGGVNAGEVPKLQEMVREMADATQLSSSFRFIPGTNRLDARTFADLERVADILTSGDHDGKTVVLASFTEAAANPAQNQPLSVQRAELIRAELVKAVPEIENRVTLKALGFGDISPLTCSGDATGQHVNSRVEVWIQG